jgi:hypothetical protein
MLDNWKLQIFSLRENGKEQVYALELTKAFIPRSPPVGEKDVIDLECSGMPCVLVLRPEPKPFPFEH